MTELVVSLEIWVHAERFFVGGVRGVNPAAGVEEVWRRIEIMVHSESVFEGVDGGVGRDEVLVPGIVLLEGVGDTFGWD